MYEIMSSGRVSPTPAGQDYRHVMKPRPLVIPTGRNLAWIIVSGVAASGAAAALTIWAQTWLTWPPLVIEYVSLIPTVGIWAAALWWIILRPVLRHKRAVGAFYGQMAALSREATAAAEAGDMPAVRMARARIVAALVSFRASSPANAPGARQVEEMLASAWPDTSDLPTTSDPAEILTQLDAHAERVRAEAGEAMERVNAALRALRDAGQRVFDLMVDHALSAEGGFNDPDKVAAVKAAKVDYARQLTDTQFVLITAAEEVSAGNPKLAAELADTYVEISSNTPRW